MSDGAKSAMLGDVKSQTDLLPADPASATNVATSTQNITDYGGPGNWTTGTAANATSSIAVLSPTRTTIPLVGSDTIQVIAYARDASGDAINLDGPAVFTARDFNGNDLTGNLGTVSSPTVGEYTATYAIASTHGEADVIFRVDGAIAGDDKFGLSETRVTAGDTVVVEQIEVRSNFLEQDGHTIRKISCSHQKITGAGLDCLRGNVHITMVSDHSDGHIRP